MIDNLALGPAPPTASVTSQPGGAGRVAGVAGVVSPASTASSADAAPVKPQSDVRLMIEEKKDAPGFIYKLVDAVTGAVLAEIPREAPSTATVSDGYATGAVVSTTA